MSTVDELHSQAMRFAQQALVARQEGDISRAQELARQAYGLEIRALTQVPPNRESEPTLSILHRSAASLAYQSGDYQAAQQEVAKGLAGYPPRQIADELNDLLSMINFELHLQREGVLLGDAELELSMEGMAVGPGIVPLSEVTDRLGHLRQLINRTIWRKMGSPFRRSGLPPKAFRAWMPMLCAPRPGSLVLPIRLGTPDRQQMPLFLEASDVIDEIVKGVELVGEVNERALHEMIDDEGYYRNFVTLTTAMAPDGKKISAVGLASRSRTATLRRPRPEITEIMLEPAEKELQVERKRVTVEGVLDYADSRKTVDLVGLTTEDGEEYTVVIEEGVDDLVRAYYGRQVAVSGTYDPWGKRILPEHIEPLED